jgi:hypothetical protein
VTSPPLVITLHRYSVHVFSLYTWTQPEIACHSLPCIYYLPAYEPYIMPISNGKRAGRSQRKLPVGRNIYRKELRITFSSMMIYSSVRYKKQSSCGYVTGLFYPIIIYANITRILEATYGRMHSILIHLPNQIIHNRYTAMVYVSL